MSTTRNGNTPFQSTKELEICLKYGKRYLLDNYNNGKNPTFLWLVGFLLSLVILIRIYLPSRAMAYVQRRYACSQ